MGDAARPSAADYEAARLYDPRAPNAADRLALLEWLVAQGITLEQPAHARAREESSLTGLAGDLAVPKEILATAEIAAEASGGGYRFEPARKRMLKGFDTPVTLFSVTRP
jgi:hypothetical protein